MTARGYYTLELTCDNSPCTQQSRVSASTCQDAVKQARSNGWKITAESHLCPSCAGSHAKLRRD